VHHHSNEHHEFVRVLVEILCFAVIAFRYSSSSTPLTSYATARGPRSRQLRHRQEQREHAEHQQEEEEKEREFMIRFVMWVCEW
jgi:hypothetical protein